MRIRIEIDGTSFRAGDAVRGRVVIPDGGPARELTARLVYREASPDYANDVTAAGSVLLHNGDLTPRSAFDFTFALPHDALPNLTSAHGALAWMVEAKVNRSGRDVVEREKVLVSVERASDAPAAAASA